MKKAFLSVLGALSFTVVQAQRQYPDINIDYKKYTLPNGLTLVVHEDHKAPIVAVNVWYHVGSKNEKPGKTGFAHLFEHLMFNGSENYNDDYFKLMERIGATDLNGTTNEDRTNYFENVPKSALETVLWAESDRMGHFVGAISQPKLDEQRGVVQNEKRQGENQPYAKAWDMMPANTYPAAHPYSWTVIGSMEDLNAASLPDVKEWFKTYYGPNNAVLVIAGDVDAEEMHAKVLKYFGDIPATPPVARQQAWIAKNTGVHRLEIQDRVPQPRILMTWNLPEWGNKQMAHFNLVNRILTSGKTSRLYKRLVYDEQLTTSVSGFVDRREIGGQFIIYADAMPQVPLAQVEAIITEEMNKLMKEGPTEEELERAKTSYFAQVVKGLERIGGFGGKSDLLAECTVYGNDPEYYKKYNNWIAKAKTHSIQSAMTEWLSDGVLVTNVTPYDEYTASAEKADRKKVPEPGKMGDVNFPDIQKSKLSNGMNVWLVERNATPVVYMQMIFDAGYAADDPALPGVSEITLSMMKEGTTSRSSLQISNELADQGATYSFYSNLDHSFAVLSALKVNFKKSLNVFGDILMHPSFPQKDFDRLKAEQLLTIKQEQAEPYSMGMRVLPKLIYGTGHAYSSPLTGSGTEESVKKMSIVDLKNYYNTWINPNNATLLVVGDMDMPELKTQLESVIGGWTTKEVPVKKVSNVAINNKPVVYLIDKPGAQQSIIYAAHISTSANDPDFDKMEMANRVLGGEFTSRINMNLREDKHWAYGAGSYFSSAKGQGFFMAYAPVQTDKTKESLVEMKKEMDQFISSRPITTEEFTKMQQNAMMQLPGSWETNGAIAYDMSKVAQYDLPENYLDNYPQMIRNMKVEDLRGAAKKALHPNNLVWVVVGDRAKIEKGLQSLNMGAIQYIDTEGNPVK